MFEELNAHRQAVRENIEKAFEIGFTENNDLEKAHQVGDVHPNGKWVWTQLPSGKFDWRVIKKKKEATPAATVDKPQPKEETEVEEKKDDKKPPKYKKETDKAVMLTLIVEAEIAPKGGFTSSMIKDRTYVLDVWIPRTQLSEDGKPSKWITDKKIEEILDKKVYNAQILSSRGIYKDENGKMFSFGETEQEKKFKKEQEKKKESAFALHKEKIKLAKKLGIKGIRDVMRKETLNQKIKDAGYNPDTFLDDNK